MTNIEEVGRPKSEDRSWKTEDRRPKTEVGSQKSEVGRPKTEDRTRHGPSARGEPLIRGKPTDGYRTVISTKERSQTNELRFGKLRSCFLRSPLGGKPEGKGAHSWLQWESRVLAAKKPVDEVGVFIPNGDCYGKKEEAPPNLPKGKGQEKRERGRPETEVGSWKKVAVCHPEQPVPNFRESRRIVAIAWDKTD